VELEHAYQAWAVVGVRRSFFTKWFRFAGRRPSRDWQPLILDDRVLKTLNHCLKVSTRQLADSRSWAKRYRAYVEAMHDWARQLSASDTLVTADRLEWILFSHAGDPDLSVRPERLKRHRRPVAGGA
jgi:hypothetical protein